MEQTHKAERYPVNWTFIKRLLDTPPPPCIQYERCEHYDRCAKYILACTAFLQYTENRYPVELDVERKPSRRIYLRAMKDE